MHALVKNGHLTLNEPTDLPEGTVVPLVIADDWDGPSTSAADEEERVPRILGAKIDARDIRVNCAHYRVRE